jgi:hypothetical protein
MQTTYYWINHHVSTDYSICLFQAHTNCSNYQRRSRNKFSKTEVNTFPNRQIFGNSTAEATNSLRRIEPSNKLKIKSSNENKKQSNTKNQNKLIPKFLGTRQRKHRVVQGGSNHALDTMLESEMQNIEIQSDG